MLEMKKRPLRRFKLDNYRYRYINGNYLVVGQHKSIKKVGFRVGEELLGDFPDSVDLKITNSCKYGCPFCHESSVPGGKSFNLKRTKRILSELPRVQIEVAIGGGNVMDVAPDALKLVKWLKHRRNLPRITINYQDVLDVDRFTLEQKKLISEVDVLGISLDKYRPDVFSAFNPTKLVQEEDENCFYYKDYVIHIIAGIFPVEDLKKLIVSERKVLILGYKQWGRAKNDVLPDMTAFREVIIEGLNNGYCFLSFDNLAIEQLRLKDVLPKEVWERNYMGDEGEHSLYIDAVNEEFAITSRSPKRFKWRNISLLEFFKYDKNRK